MKILKLRRAVQPADPWHDGRPLPWLIDLSEWLRLAGGYGQPERSRILTSLLDHGTLVHAAESGLIDREDYALLEAIYVESQPPVDFDDPAWDDAEVWAPGPPELPGTVLEFPALEELQQELQEMRQELQSVGLTQLALASSFNFRKWRESLGLPYHSTAELPGDPLDGDLPF